MLLAARMLPVLTSPAAKSQEYKAPVYSTISDVANYKTQQTLETWQAWHLP